MTSHTVVYNSVDSGTILSQLFTVERFYFADFFSECLSCNCSASESSSVESNSLIINSTQHNTHNSLSTHNYPFNVQGQGVINIPIIIQLIQFTVTSSSTRKIHSSRYTRLRYSVQSYAQ